MLGGSDDSGVLDTLDSIIRCFPCSIRVCSEPLERPSVQHGTAERSSGDRTEGYVLRWFNEFLASRRASRDQSLNGRRITHNTLITKLLPHRQRPVIEQLSVPSGGSSDARRELRNTQSRSDAYTRARHSGRQANHADQFMWLGLSGSRVTTNQQVHQTCTRLGCLV
jgi:hypothetical protein